MTLEADLTCMVVAMKYNFTRLLVVVFGFTESVVLGTTPPTQAEEAPKPLIEIRGRVLLPDGTPAPNPYLQVQEFGDSDGRYPAATDENGEFSDMVRVGNLYAIIVRSSQHRGGVEEKFASPVIATVVTDPPTPGQFDIQLQKGIRVHGTIKYASGEPAADQNIVFSVFPFRREEEKKAPEDQNHFALFGRVAFQTYSDKNGNYERFLLPGEYHVRASNMFGDDAEKILVVNPSHTEIGMDFTLSAATLGKVTLPDGTPAANMEFWAVKNMSDTSTATEYTKTDQDGRFRVFLSPLVNMLAFGTKDGRFGLNYPIDGKNRFEPLDLVLQPPATGKVRLLSGRTGKPIVGYKLSSSASYSPLSDKGVSVTSEDVKSDAEGYVTLKRLYLGAQYRLSTTYPVEGRPGWGTGMSFEFVPKKSGEVIDLGEKRIDADFSAFESPEPEVVVSTSERQTHRSNSVPQRYRQRHRKYERLFPVFRNRSSSEKLPQILPARP